jgi:hypothetical protein
MIYRLSTAVILIFLGIILFPAGSLAQEPTQTLRGQIIEEYTELPVPFATVIISDSDPLIGTMSDVNGNFRFNALPAGRISVKISMVGYKSRELHDLLLTSGKELVLEIKLEEQVYELEDITVRPVIKKDQPINEMALVSVRSFTVDETERYAGSLGDPSRMASSFAGVSSMSDQRNDIVIRGNSPLGLLWRLEGIEIPNPNHFGSLGSTGGPVSMINNNLLANSDFYTGAFPAEYGNAMSGAFDLKLRNGNNQKYEYIGQVGFNGFESGAEGPFGKSSKASWLVNFRYSTLEVLKAMGMNFGTGTAIPKYKDFTFKLNFPLKKGRISAFGLGGVNNIAMLDSKNDQAQFGFSGTDLYSSNIMGVTGINHVHNFTVDTRLSTSFSISEIEGTAEIYDLSFSLDTAKIDERLGELKYTVSTKFSHRFSKRNYFNAGIILDYYSVHYTGKAFDCAGKQYVYYLNNSGEMSFGKAFSEWQHRYTDELTIVTGIHYSRLFLNNSYAFEPRLAMKWEFIPGHTLNIGAGLHSQTQMRAVYFSQKLIDTLEMKYEQTNRNLDFSRSLQLVAGYNCLMGEGHRLKLEGYYQKLYNLPVSGMRPEFSLINQGGGFSYMVFDNMENSGKGYNRGVELTMEKFLYKGFYYLFTASVFDAHYRGYDGKLRNSAFNNNYVFNILGGYEWALNRKAMFGMNLKAVYAGGYRYLPVDVEKSIESNSIRYKWSEAYEKRYPDYFRLNVRMTFRVNGQAVSQVWALDLQNITNRKNIFTRNWNSQKKELDTSYQTGFMPMVTYRIVF